MTLRVQPLRVHTRVASSTSHLHTPVSRMCIAGKPHAGHPSPPPSPPRHPHHHGRDLSLGARPRPGGPLCRAVAQCPAPSLAGRVPNSSTPAGSRRRALGARSAPEGCRSEKKGWRRETRSAPSRQRHPGRQRPAPSRKQGEDPAPVTSPPARSARASRAHAWPPLAHSRNRRGPAARRPWGEPLMGGCASPAQPEDEEGVSRGRSQRGTGMAIAASGASRR